MNSLFQSVLGLLLFSQLGFAGTFVMLPTPNHAVVMSRESTKQIVTQIYKLDDYRSIRAQVVAATTAVPQHVIVQLLAKTTHKADVAAIYVDNNGKILSHEPNYHITAEDRQQTDAVTSNACPDTSVQFIAFAPNDDSLEQQVTVDVANAAKAHGLKTISLLLKDATRQNYLNYMSCPNLVGNFYDGDANPDLFTTVDGTLSSDDMKTLNFNFHVTNIWLACEAFNDPMLSAVTKNAAAQKYAAGINDLEIGPSDNTGKCAMIAAINGQPMTDAFHQCYTQYDKTTDQWGFDGQGSDLFGH